jgi:hypothetical protein
MGQQASSFLNGFESLTYTTWLGVDCFVIDGPWSSNLGGSQRLCSPASFGGDLGANSLKRLTIKGFEGVPFKSLAFTSFATPAYLISKDLRKAMLSGCLDGVHGVGTICRGRAVGDQHVRGGLLRRRLTVRRVGAIQMWSPHSLRGIPCRLLVLLQQQWSSAWRL